MKPPRSRSLLLVLANPRKPYISRMDNPSFIPAPTSIQSLEAPVTDTMSIDRLLPAQLECFGIILLGYVAGRANIITATQAKGLGNFVSKFALPALLFKNMVLLDFGNVIWPFLWSILIAKVSVFFAVCILTLLVTGRDGRFAKAGLYSIFATQSNDFALGYPIVEALYKNTHPEYLQYIYLVAPISLMILNPIGFAFCEVQKWQDRREPQQSKLHIVGLVVLQVLKNPIVFMVVVGIGLHFILSATVPAFMEGFVDGLANSFGGSALFYLGLTMVGQMRRLTRSTVAALILLITAKLLVMPLVSRDMVELLDVGNTSEVDHSSLSNYAFLYGVFPTAPSVAIYAAHYNMELEVITSGMVISTFLSAPIMFVSAWLLTIPSMDPKCWVEALQNASFNMSIISLVALVWTVAVMFLSKKFRRLPHVFTLNFFLAQLLVSVGMISWNFAVRQDSFIGRLLCFTLLYSSLYSTYMWPGLIALSLLLMKKYGELKVRPSMLVIIGWAVPALTVAILLMAGEWVPDTIDSAFYYGRPQIICTSVVLSCSILLVGGSLVGLSRGSEDYQTPEPPCSTTEEETAENEADNQNVCELGSPDMRLNGAPTTDTAALRVYKPVLLLTGPCGSPCDSTQCLLVQEEQQQQGLDRQVARHVLLCLLLTVVLLANLSSCLWWLFNRVPGRLYLELQFFCVVVNFGQGFISFGLFGLDKHLIILPFKKRVARLWNSRGAEGATSSAVPEEVRQTCTQFVKYHKEQCVKDIVQKKRCGKRSVVDAFLGSELVEWLMQVGLASDRGEAHLYGTRLLEGGVLQHITQEYGFQDDSLHYRFIAASGLGW
ncbi:integral membrane protein GPR155 isoform X2 [Denticeps clupeoides]|uniref:DEP domain-containing protein n=1 Tax=Denticeps clupeoides TaxID=299321 RepID=A0AAY4EV22_9TELE|nr:integral membrane protein GPR155-like isoform X2 [Denticeps clupeoides]